MCHLIMSKTRLMPLKAISIPRGELMACQLAIRLAKSVCEQLGLNKCRVKYLSDSTTALWWIKSEPRKFRPFVANRVAEILSESDPTQWHHIGTKLNIADIASRGTSVADISADSTWIQGPEFLKSEFSEWPVDKVAVDFPEPSRAELKKSVLKAKVAPAKPVIDPARILAGSNLPE